MLSENINQEIKQAMLAKNEAQLRGLRAIKAAFLLAQTEKGAKEALSEETELKILQKLIKQRKESADIYQTQRRADLYQVEAEEIEVISQFLPQALEPAEVENMIAQIIKDSGASSMKDMGQTIRLANEALAGRADGKLIAEIVKQKLA